MSENTEYSQSPADNARKRLAAPVPSPKYVRRQLRRWTYLRRTFIVIAVVSGFVMVVSLITDLQKQPISLWIAATSFILMAVCTMLAESARYRLRAATFARAHRSTGIVTEIVFIPPPTPDYSHSHDFMIRATTEAGAVIRRRLDMGGEREADRWVGQPIRFQHRTLDPENLDDVYFDYEDRKASLDLHR
ncbi:MAG: hypothetical protein ACTIBG_16040 [Brevibacterium aurantiacum]|uniref:hypothetical protein n=1 Tax=Brevibacterium aurantiacum TaxID=273384 RepID=UPI001868C704|nr:hypothetical protein [Brevibacterium aurantiacum]